MITIDCSVAAVTFSEVFPLIPFNAAVIVEVPTVTPVANPPDVIVATALVPDVHVTVPVMFAVVVSEYVPVAVNCCVVPFATVGFTGVTAIDCNVAAVTFSEVFPLIPFNAAVIVEVPTVTPVANPPT